MKHAIVRPLLKKSNMSLCNLGNNNFLSKVLEKVVVRQLVGFMNSQGIHDPLQSAYKNAHGVETALMKVKSDIDHALDQGDGVLLVLWLIVTSSRNKEQILRRTPQIKVGYEIIKPSPVVRNLEAYILKVPCVWFHM